jgi:hypothetical protein
MSYVFVLEARGTCFPTDLIHLVEIKHFTQHRNSTANQFSRTKITEFNTTNTKERF